MRLAAEGAQHVDRVGIALRQRPAVADAHHLRAAAFIFSFLPGNVRRYFGCAGSVTSTIEVPFGSALPVMRIDRLRNVVGAAVVADIGDPAVALVMDGRLIGAARLQIVGADQLHVGGFRRRADHLLLRVGEARARKNETTARGSNQNRLRVWRDHFMLSTPMFKTNLRRLTTTIARPCPSAKNMLLTCNHLVGAPSGLAGDPVQPQEPAGDRQRARHQDGAAAADAGGAEGNGD